MKEWKDERVKEENVPSRKKLKHAVRPQIDGR